MASPPPSPKPSPSPRKGGRQSFAGWFSLPGRTRSGGKSAHGASERAIEKTDPLVDLQVGRTLWEGVPRNMRAELWLSILAQNGRGPAFGSLYRKLPHAAVPADVKEAIFKDVSRSFPTHEFFREKANQQALYRLLRAYAAYDPEIGYCQGMNFVAGAVLLYLAPGESDAFAAMVVLMQERGLRGHYTHDMRMLQVRLWQMGQLMPAALVEHLEQHGVLTALYASAWFLTLFASEMPLSFVGRMLDVLLSASDDSVLMKVALRIMAELQPRLLELQDMESIITLIKTEPPKWSQDKLRAVLTDALCHDWDGEEEAMYSSGKEAETVREAIDRNNRMRQEAAEVSAPGVEDTAGESVDSSADLAGSPGSSAADGTPTKAGNSTPSKPKQQLRGNLPEGSPIPRLAPPPKSPGLQVQYPPPPASAPPSLIQLDSPPGARAAPRSAGMSLMDADESAAAGIAAALATPLGGGGAGWEHPWPGFSLAEREPSHGAFLHPSGAPASAVQQPPLQAFDSFGSFQEAPGDSPSAQPGVRRDNSRPQEPTTEASVPVAVGSTSEASLTAAILASLNGDIRAPTPEAGGKRGKVPSMREQRARQQQEQQELQARQRAQLCAKGSIQDSDIGRAVETDSEGLSRATHMAAMLRLNKGSFSKGGHGGGLPVQLALDASPGGSSSADGAPVWDEAVLASLSEAAPPGSPLPSDAELRTLVPDLLEAETAALRELQLSATLSRCDSSASSVDGVPVWDEAQLSAIRKIGFWDTLGQQPANGSSSSWERSGEKWDASETASDQRVEKQLGNTSRQLF